MSSAEIILSLQFEGKETRASKKLSTLQASALFAIREKRQRLKQKDEDRDKRDRKQWRSVQ